MKRLFLLLIMLLPLLVGAKKLRPLVWVLDAGHGGKDQGTSVGAVLEKDLNLQITNEVTALLRKHKPGIKLILTRTDDRFISLEERCRIANNAGADLFLSIHINYVERKPLMSGTETFFGNLAKERNSVRSGTIIRSSEKSELLAWLLQKSYHDAGRNTDRGAKPERYHVLLNTNMPAALTEVGFLSNINDRQLITTKAGQQSIAACIVNALLEYYTTTQAGTHRKTLETLRRSGGTRSGIDAPKVKAQSKPTAQKPAVSTLTTGEPLPEGPTTETVVTEEVTSAETIVEGAVATQESATLEPVGTEADEGTATIARGGSDPSEVTFYVQLFSVKAQLTETDNKLKGLAPITQIKVGDIYKVLYGATPSYEAARNTLKDIRTNFPDAFVVAYIGNTPIPVSEAKLKQK